MHNSRHDGATANFDFFERRDVGPSPPERDSLNPSPALTSSWRGEFGSGPPPSGTLRRKFPAQIMRGGPAHSNYFYTRARTFRILPPIKAKEISAPRQKFISAGPRYALFIPLYQPRAGRRIHYPRRRAAARKIACLTDARPRGGGRRVPTRRRRSSSRSLGGGKQHTGRENTRGKGRESGRPIKTRRRK